MGGQVVDTFKFRLFQDFLDFTGKFGEISVNTVSMTFPGIVKIWIPICFVKKQLQSKEAYGFGTCQPKKFSTL